MDLSLVNCGCYRSIIVSVETIRQIELEPLFSDGELESYFAKPVRGFVGKLQRPLLLRGALRNEVLKRKIRIIAAQPNMDGWKVDRLVGRRFITRENGID